MAFPNILINTSGSDTAASGAGPATALTGTLAATHANTTVNITDVVDLSGVAVDGTAALWVSSSSGKQWSKITAISGSSGAWVVTVAKAYANTESGRTWAIGGKRKTCQGSIQLFSDLVTAASPTLIGWTVDIQTGETTTAVIPIATTVDSQQSPILITSTTFTTWGTQPLLQTATNSQNIFDVGGVQNLEFRNLQFKCTAVTPGNGFLANTVGNANRLTWLNCIFDGFSRGIYCEGNNSIFYPIIDGCEFKNCTTAGVHLGGGNPSVYRSFFHANVVGLAGGTTSADKMIIDRCVFDSNTSSTGALTPNGAENMAVTRCTFRSNTGDGWTCTGSGLAWIIQDNIFYGNGKYGLNASGGADSIICTNNAFGSNNGAGTGLNYPASFSSNSLSEITLTASPFVSASDSGLNSTAGGGKTCKNAASQVPNATANVAGDVGAIPSGGGSAGSPVSANVRGGFQN